MKSLIKNVPSPLWGRSQIVKQRSRSLRHSASADIFTIESISNGTITLEEPIQPTSKIEMNKTTECASNCTTIWGITDTIPLLKFDETSNQLGQKDGGMGASFGKSNEENIQFNGRLDSTENQKSILMFILQKLHTTELDMIEMSEENNSFGQM